MYLEDSGEPKYVVKGTMPIHGTSLVVPEFLYNLTQLLATLYEGTCNLPPCWFKHDLLVAYAYDLVDALQLRWISLNGASNAQANKVWVEFALQGSPDDLKSYLFASSFLHVRDDTQPNWHRLMGNIIKACGHHQNVPTFAGSPQIDLQSIAKGEKMTNNEDELMESTGQTSDGDAGEQKGKELKARLQTAISEILLSSIQRLAYAVGKDVKTNQSIMNQLQNEVASVLEILSERRYSGYATLEILMETLNVESAFFLLVLRKLLEAELDVWPCLGLHIDLIQEFSDSSVIDLTKYIQFYLISTISPTDETSLNSIIEKIQNNERTLLMKMWTNALKSTYRIVYARANFLVGSKCPKHAMHSEKRTVLLDPKPIKAAQIGS